MHNKNFHGPVEGSFQATFRSVIIENATQITNDVCSNIFCLDDCKTAKNIVVVVIKDCDYIIEYEEHAHMILDVIKYVETERNPIVELRITTRTNQLKIHSLEVVKYK